ncbi:MAG: hypothetical protein DMG93_13410 [Acidobacteria bacterium]|nr:MAG: hypothetical protein DMG93_13410 [Acidobacteriota bacterium]
MRSRTFGLASICLFAGLCIAQDSQPNSDRGSVAAAAKASRGQAQVQQDKQADIRRLLEITGSGALATQSMDQMEKTIRPMVTDALPPGEYRAKVVDLFFEKFRSKRDPANLMNLVIPIYDKYYSDEDIRGLIQLYQTPLGKKMLSTLPNVMAESQAAGTKWGEQIGRESMMEVLTEHPELQKAMEEAKNNAQSH